MNNILYVIFIFSGLILAFFLIRELKTLKKNKSINTINEPFPKSILANIFESKLTNYMGLIYSFLMIIYGFIGLLGIFKK